ncbi:C39 family peptidase [Candidatus Falkowbacteria bacterium]|nr:C39 family peptidase [Candidatus Falkowbacteria bacterium]
MTTQSQYHYVPLFETWVNKDKIHNIFVPQFENPLQTDLEMKCKNVFCDYAQPRWNWCALCSLAMIRRAQGGDPDLKNLFKDACKRGVYRENPDYASLPMSQKSSTRKWIGAFHKDLATFILRRTGLPAVPFRGIETDEALVGLLDADNALLLSVGSQINTLRWRSTQPTSGHLILVYGYGYTLVDGEAGRRQVTHLVTSNPAGLYVPYSQHHVALPIGYVREWSCGRGVAVLT